ncbi:MAG: hypothetical protein MUC68_05605 [Burkholderiaceae bacterium]|jgi:hypothetical protein|nr:hypothetical protein [Burkholderiaceae bacterium]
MAAPNDKLIYSKTPKGVAEVAARGGALSMAARRVLIMIDGKRSLGELAAMLRNSDLDGVIGLLEGQGFVQRASGGAPATVSIGLRADDSAVAPVAREPAPREALDVNTVSNDLDERPLLTIEEAKRRAVRELNERLGPEAEIMSVRLEQTRSADELRDRLREAERLVAGLLGEAAAADYLRALRRR